jgi:hypothetical protein
LINRAYINQRRKRGLVNNCLNIWNPYPFSSWLEQLSLVSDPIILEFTNRILLIIVAHNSTPLTLQPPRYSKPHRFATQFDSRCHQIAWQAGLITITSTSLWIHVISKSRLI